MDAVALSLLVACGVLLFIAWEDWRSFKIRNNAVLALIAVYGVYLVAKGFASWQGDLFAGLVLFVIGFVFWLFRLMGAGDAKLYFPVGLFMGWEGLGPFAILLMLFSLFIAALVKLPVPLPFQSNALMIRLQEIRKGKSVPYGVPIALAAIGVMLSRLAS